MTTFTAQTEKFLNSEIDFLNRDLMQAVIEQLGGEQEFLDSYSDISEYGIDGGFGGFIYYHETVDFFNDNFDAIKQYFSNAAECLGLNSAIALLLQNEQMKEKLDLTNEEVAEAFFAIKDSAEKSSCERVQLCNWVSWAVATDTANAYSDFLHTIEQDA